MPIPRAGNIAPTGAAKGAAGVRRATDTARSPVRRRVDMNRGDGATTASPGVTGNIAGIVVATVRVAAVCTRVPAAAVAAARAANGSVR